MFELVENRLFAYADDSTLLTVVRKPADRPAVVASLLAGTWLGFMSGAITGAWYGILTKPRLPSLVEPGLCGLSMVTWSCLGFLSELVPTSTSLAWSLKQAHIRRPCGGIVSRVSQRIGIFRLLKGIVNTSALLRCYFAFVLPILEYCSPVWGQLLNVIFSFLSARCIRWPGFVPIRVSCRCVIDVVYLGLICCTRLIRTLITNHYSLRASICFY